MWLSRMATPNPRQRVGNVAAFSNLHTPNDTARLGARQVCSPIRNIQTNSCVTAAQVSVDDHKADFALSALRGHPLVRYISEAGRISKSVNNAGLSFTTI